jgi:hypothetical protein
MVYQLIYRTPYKTATGAVPLDGDMMDVRVLDPETADPVTRHRGRAINSGYPVDPATVPRIIVWKSDTRQVTDLIMAAGAYIVSRRFRDLVESFEPGVHQFLEVDIRRPNGKHISTRYFMQSCHEIDSVDAKHTTWIRRGAAQTGMWDNEGIMERELFFSRKQIGVAHLWRDLSIAADLFCSNELGDKIINMRLTGAMLDFYPEV